MSDSTTPDLVRQINKIELKVVEGLSNVNANMKVMAAQIGNLVEQVKKQNGNVSDLNNRMAEVEKHPINCIMREKFAQMEQVISTGDHKGSVHLLAKIEAVENDTASHLKDVGKKELCQGVWKEKFWLPLAKTGATMFLGMLLLLLALHIQELIAK